LFENDRNPQSCPDKRLRRDLRNGHLGTPTGEADSGTLEEIERVAKAGKPVMLYFSHVPVDPNRVDFTQMELLKSFRNRILANALVETFGSSLDFRDKFANSSK
jgi:hypothetical protein